ncbi:Protein MNN4 [Meyerozyma sp. JA9]|nr:Protein MNN4 [Meyerozyma sp. JA9]
MFPKIYNKKLKHGIPLLITAACIFFTLNSYLSDDISQYLLEANALHMNRQSSFDPRSITYALFSYVNSLNGHELISFSDLGNKNGVYFHWDDWVDLSPAKSILGKYRQKYPQGQCDSVLRNFADVNGYFMESYNKKVYRGMADLYCLKDIPERVIISTDKAFVHIPVIGKKRLGEANLPYNIYKDQMVNEMMKIQTSDDLAFKVADYKPLEHEVNIKAEDFIFNLDSNIFHLQEQLNNNTISPKDLEYLQFLEYSSALIEKSDTYFKYPWIITDVIQGRSHHLAYPFFKRFIGDRERQSVIHHMIRVWFQFAESNNIPSWINYGSLLGWSYNGVNMPWDTDIDVQMPIRHLDRLGREFNRSIIIENPRYGNGKYYLEVAPTYTAQGNGRNFIDARFIDINTGLYIDISALAHTNFKPPKKLFKGLENVEDLKAMTVHCKNWNWHTLDELLPLRHTYFEGGEAYIPRNVSRILTRKYGKTSFTTKNRFKNHNYQKDIRLWVPDRICKSSPRQRFQDEEGSALTLKGACNSPRLQDEFRIVHESAQRRLDLEVDVDNSIYYDTEQTPPLSIFRKDAWDYYNDINKKLVTDDNWYVREEIVR